MPPTTPHTTTITLPGSTAAEMIANVRVIMEHLKTAHHSHTPEITFETPDRASGIWAMSGLSVWNQGDGGALVPRHGPLLRDLREARRHLAIH